METQQAHKHSPRMALLLPIIAKAFEIGILIATNDDREGSLPYLKDCDNNQIFGYEQRLLRNIAADNHPQSDVEQLVVEALREVFYDYNLGEAEENIQKKLQAIAKMQVYADPRNRLAA